MYRSFPKFIVSTLLLVVVGLLTIGRVTSAAAPVENPQTGSVGLQGRISAPAPTQAPTITFPANGQVFTNVPITVTGLCPKGLLVKLFKNNVFTGSAQCDNGSYSIQIDLFSGRNDLVARAFDALDQAGPDSNTVSVTFNDIINGELPSGARLSLSSIYAKRGATPGETLTWPLLLSGGTGPYAVSVDWGDGKAPDLLSLDAPGDFSIKHIYDRAGVYTVIIKATDKNGVTTYLQVVGIGNGSGAQGTTETKGNQVIVNKLKILWWPAVVMLPLILLAFWLGKRHELYILRKKLEGRE